MSANEFRIAIVGTGFMARKHCNALAVEENAHLVTICSTPKSKHIAERFAMEFGFKKITQKYGDVLDDPEIDIVFLCTPDHLHPEQVILALNAGKNVFCEKPLARKDTEFKDIDKTLQSSNKVLQVGMNCRFREQYSIPKSIVDSGKLGVVRVIRGNYIYNAIDSVRNREKKWALEYPSEIFPFLHGGGIHCLDLMRWMGGPVKKVFSKAKALELGEEYIADTFLINLEFKNDVLGELLVSASAYRPNEFSLEIWLSKGSIVGTSVYEMIDGKLQSKPSEIEIKQQIIDLGLQYKDLYAAIQNCSHPLNSFSEAYENFKVLNAIEESIRSGMEVNLLSN